MGVKSFSEQEREIIRTKLLESCEECWCKYGYRRTNIRELCDMSGISTGAFYLFFSSKEHLFFETAQFVGDRIGLLVYQTIPENPTKYDFAKTLKALYKEFEKVEWYLRRREEFAFIVRKLPPDFIEKSQSKDATNLTDIIEKYGLTPKVEMNQIITTFSLLSLSILQKKIFGESFDKSFAFMIDVIVGAMFV